MENRRLGRTDLSVSVICLGTMTWGEQNTEAEAFEQMDYAVAQGINFFDAAEMYPVPPRPETQGRTELYVGNWFRQRGGRDRIVLASKVTGRAPMPWIRGGPTLSRQQILEAADASLKRLQTDYLDLYQLHWPDRNTNYFGKLGYEHRQDDNCVPLAESVATLGELLKVGKIRHWGISNETPWGLMQCLHIAAKLGLPPPVSIQNPYSLLNRSFEVGLAECAHRENVGLLAYSPLGFGVLSGKYLNGDRPAGARVTLFKRFNRYTNPQAEQAVAQYVQLARTHGLDPAQMALAYVTSRPFLTSNIIGATTMEQLRSNIASHGLRLSAEVVKGIEAIHQAQPNPAP